MPLLDLEFEWPVDTSGYRVEKRTFRPSGGRKPTAQDWIMPKGGRVERRQPFAYQKMLYADFAGLAETPAACLDFASKFGLLGLTRHPGIDAAVRSKAGEGESLLTWYGLIRTMRAQMELWQDDPRKLVAEGPRDLTVNDIAARLVPGGRGKGPLLSLLPTTLYGAMELQLALAVSAGAELRGCRNCGTLFEAGGESERNRKAQFCSDRCRMEHHYNLRKTS
jgi:hypothetical protein